MLMCVSSVRSKVKACGGTKKAAECLKASQAGWKGGEQTRRCISCARRQCTTAADAVALENLSRSAKRRNRGSEELGHAHPPGTSGNLTAGIGHLCGPSPAPKQTQQQLQPGMPEWTIFHISFGKWHVQLSLRSCINSTK